jgi:hypothetical protein
VSSVMDDLKRLEDRILARIRELEANVAELEQLREVAARLGILDGDRGDSPSATRPARATTRRRRPVRAEATVTDARPGGARTATSATGPSTRRERVLEIVAQLGVNRTSLYPVVRQLMSDGLLHKDGRGLWLASR